MRGGVAEISSKKLSMTARERDHTSSWRKRKKCYRMAPAGCSIPVVRTIRVRVDRVRFSAARQTYIGAIPAPFRAVVYW